MKNLFELVKIVKEIKLKSTDFLVSDKERKTKANTFYQKILSQELTNDVEASAFLFSSTPNHTGYKNLKYQLRDKLVNTFFFYKPKKTASDYEKSIIYCTKYYMAGSLLILLGVREIGRDLCLKVFKKATYFELTEFIMLSSRELRREFIYMEGNIDKYNQYNEKHKESKEVFDIESLVEECYFNLTSQNRNSVEYQSDTSKMAMDYYTKFQPYLDKFSSAKLHLFLRSIHSISYLAKQDFKNAIKVCENALYFFEKKPYKYTTGIRVFCYQLLICCIQLKDYHRGKTITERTLNILKSGTNSWYVNQELFLLLALHSKEYKEAYRIISLATSHYQFKRIRQDHREKWQINKAYVYFLIYINKINLEKEKPKTLRMGKFLNSIPIYSKDKRGMNIPILIIQILFLIVKKDYDQLMDRLESIQKYSSRYLRANANIRSNCFINMLLQIPKANFHRVAVERKSQKYYDKLLANPMNISNQAWEVEIIPYEDLWAFILDSLELKIHSSK